ncbi:MAG: hypothetical protein OEV94_06245 [Deltaproteobacteria bacterium]|nr:hypothetical protein [Deltaproteobacteria bacterium]
METLLHIKTMPPWKPGTLFSEEGLQAAKEYFFQTHAQNAQLIDEGRQATGIMKSLSRRKMERDFGEDFKMYTGSTLGDDSASTVSHGIRGDMNRMLEVIYKKIKPQEPIVSPLQEDLVILSHPLGALEVVFSMVYFYTSLLKRHASVAGNRRKVLKALMDEEFFKWLWRMCMAFFLSVDRNKFNFHNNIHSSGLEFIPVAKQRVSTVDKIVEIGQFLLGPTISDSHLRFPMCFYFGTYLQYIQYFSLSHLDDKRAEAVLKDLQSVKPDEGFLDIMIASAYLMEKKGAGGQSFREVSNDEDEDGLGVEGRIPEDEMDFLAQFRFFSAGNVVNATKKFLPQGAAPGEQPRSMMVTLLLLRLLPLAARMALLSRIPAPILSVMLTRMGHGADEMTLMIGSNIREEIELRKQKGETYALPGYAKGQKAGVTTTSSRKPAGRTESGGAGRMTGGDSQATGQPQAEPQDDQTPATETPAEGANKPAVEVKTEAPQNRREEDKGDAYQPSVDQLMDERVIIRWRVSGMRVEVQSISPRDMDYLAGPDPRFLGPLVLFAIHTSQVFRIPPENVTKEVVDKILATILSRSPKGVNPRLHHDIRNAMVQIKLSPKKFMETLLDKSQGLLRGANNPGVLADPIQSLSEKLGEKVLDFLKNPGDSAFGVVRQGLSPQEKHAASVLYRISRLP